MPKNDIIFKKLQNLKAPSVEVSYIYPSIRSTEYVCHTTYIFWHRTTQYIAAHIMFVVL